MTRVYLSDAWFIVLLLQDVTNADQWRHCFDYTGSMNTPLEFFVMSWFYDYFFWFELITLPLRQPTEHLIQTRSPFVKIGNKSSEPEGNRIVSFTYRILMLDYESSRHWSGAWLLFQLRRLVKKYILHSSYIPRLTWRWCLVAAFQVWNTHVFKLKIEMLHRIFLNETS